MRQKKLAGIYLCLLALVVASVFPGKSIAEEVGNRSSSCSMTRVTSPDSWVFDDGFTSGEGIYTYFDPEVDCGVSGSIYPYELLRFDFMLGGSTDEVSLDVVVYDLAVSGDPCDGPGEELYREEFATSGDATNASTFFFPSEGHCVDRPFFIGLEFQHDGLPGPAHQSDDPPVAGDCEDFIRTSDGFFDAVDSGFAHYPAFWVFGQTWGRCGQTCCIPPSVGDADQSGQEIPHNVDGIDLAIMLNDMFLFLYPSTVYCWDELDLDFSCGRPCTNFFFIDGIDLSLMLDHLFISLDPLPQCDGTPNR